MKAKNLLFTLFIVLTGLFLQNCTKDEEPGENQETNNSLPSSFKVDIPNSISQPNAATGLKSNQGDTLNGNEIYEHLTTFIHVGESAADIVESIISSIRTYQINKAMEFSYQGDDNRAKNAKVTENSMYNGREWEFGLTITDAGSETNADGGKGMQIFWNRQPVEGISILKPYNINREEDQYLEQAVFRIDYTEDSEYNYDAHMIVYIADMPIPSTLAYEDAKYAMKSLKMFAGKKGDVVDVYGNSNHPNAKFLSNNTGFNWAFVAAGSDQDGAGVAEVGLPPSSLDSENRTTLLENYSIKSVFESEIHAALPGIDSTTVSRYLYNTQPPGYFDEKGFMQGGTSPGETWSALAERLKNLTPYNPKELYNLEITFKD